MTRLKATLIILIPIILIIISIITSIISFNFSKLADESYIYVENKYETPKYSGDYYSIIGNLTDDAHRVTSEVLAVDDTESYQLAIKIYDSSDNLLESYILKITTNEMDTLINNIEIQVTDGILFELEDYIIKITLNEGTAYKFELKEIDNNTNKDEIDLVFFNLDNENFDKQDLYEGISFTTMIFAIISGLTIISIIFIKKE